MSAPAKKPAQQPESYSSPPGEAVRGWGNRPTPVFQEIYDTDGMVDFITGYAGYSYEKHTENLMEHIRASVDSGIPVLARLKKDGAPYLERTLQDSSRADSFRIIVGCDGNKLRSPAPKGALDPPKRNPRLREIDSIYVIIRAARRYTLLDGLRRIKRVMDCDRAAGAWDAYIHAFEGYHDTDLHTLKRKELRQRFEYAWKGMNWNCHYIGEAFHCWYERAHDAPEAYERKYANWIWEELKDPRIGPVGERLGTASADSHTRQWQMHALYKTQKWKKKYQKYDWGTCETAAMILRRIREDDGIIYDAVCEMIGILEEDAK